MGQFISPRMSPEGSSLYLVEGVDDLVVGYARDPSTGSLTKLPAPFGCRRSTPCYDRPRGGGVDRLHADSGTAYYILATATGAAAASSSTTTAPTGRSPHSPPRSLVWLLSRRRARPCRTCASTSRRWAISPDGRNAYVVGQERSLPSRSLANLGREPPPRAAYRPSPCSVARTASSAAPTPCPARRRRCSTHASPAWPSPPAAASSVPTCPRRRRFPCAACRSRSRSPRCRPR